MSGVQIGSGRVVTAFEARDTLRTHINHVETWLWRAILAVPDKPPEQTPDEVELFGTETVRERFETHSASIERLEWEVQRVELAAEQARGMIRRKRLILAEAERIAKLRETAGRDPAEAAAFTAKADKLQRRLDAELESEAQTHRPRTVSAKRRRLW